jgi:predicted amidohydrolase YtcJ
LPRMTPTIAGLDPRVNMSAILPPDTATDSATRHRHSGESSAGDDVLVFARRIHTMVGRHERVGALLIRNGIIAGTGSREDMRAAAPGATVLDLGAAVVTPGLTDSHIHLTEWAFARSEADLSSAASPEQAAATAVDHAATANTVTTSTWLRGRGWNAHLWNGRQPDRHVLDAFTGRRPAALQSHDMHSLWVNSAALAEAGIDASTPDPQDGRIVRDEQGEPTGLLLEWAGQLVMQALPVPSLQDAAAAVLQAQAELHSLGITGVHSFPGVHITEPDPLAVLMLLRERRELRLRVLQHIAAASLDHAIALGLRSGFGDDWLRIGAVKMFLDGALGSKTAWMREPYEGEAGCGICTLDPDTFRATVRRAAAAGIATTVHAIGDAAVCVALDVLAEADVRVPALPHRIEHLQCCPPDRFGDAAAAGITCSMQPSHLITDWSIADRCWGARSQGAFAVGSLLAAGTVLAYGSDAPVEPVDPRRGLFAAVARQDYEGRPDGGWQPQQRIDMMAALRGYTTGAAAAAGLPIASGHTWPLAPRPTLPRGMRTRWTDPTLPVTCSAWPPWSAGGWYTRHETGK